MVSRQRTASSGCSMQQPRCSIFSTCSLYVVAFLISIKKCPPWDTSVRGAGGPVTLNIQSFSEKSKHPFTRLDKNRPSFRVNTGRLRQAGRYRNPCGSTIAMRAWLRHSPCMVLRVRRLSTRSGGSVRPGRGGIRLVFPKGMTIWAGPGLKRGGLLPLYNKEARDAQGHLQRRRHIRNLATCCLS